jgi:hypothetical protein
MSTSPEKQPPDFKPPETFDVKALADILRKRHRPAVKRKPDWGTDDPDLDRREPHPFDEP